MAQVMINSQVGRFFNGIPANQEASRYSSLFCLLEKGENASSSSIRVIHSDGQYKATTTNFLFHIAIGTDLNVPTRKISNEIECEIKKQYKCHHVLPRMIELSDSISTSTYKKDESKAKARFVLAMTQYMEESNEREASRYLMVEVEDYLRSKQVSNINDMLLSIESYDLSPRALVCILRSTFRAKEFLPGWKDAFTFTQKQIESLGKNSKAWLVGLK